MKESRIYWSSHTYPGYRGICSSEGRYCRVSRGE